MGYSKDLLDVNFLPIYIQMCSASPRVGSRILEAQHVSSFKFSTKGKAFCSRIPYLLTPAKMSCNSPRLVCSSPRTISESITVSREGNEWVEVVLAMFSTLGTLQEQLKSAEPPKFQSQKRKKGKQIRQTGFKILARY